MLFILELSYFEISDRFNIVDKPNERSSHKIPTIRGGGVIFLLSVILFFFRSGYSYPYLLTAMMISGIVSFIDDIRTVSNPIKFVVHILSVILLFKECEFLNLPISFLVVIGIVVIGVINAYNFMDGINGITGLYSLAVIVPLFITEFNSILKSLELFSIIGLLVFNFFNTRKNARCFAGDIGSICQAIVIVFLLLMRIKETNQFTYIGFLLVYGIDSVYTILQRLYQKENIFTPHRKHLYQYLCNEKLIPHVWVSAVYAFLQLTINLLIVFRYINCLSLLLLLVFLSIIYWLIKAPLIKYQLNKISSSSFPDNFL